MRLSCPCSRSSPHASSIAYNEANRMPHKKHLHNSASFRSNIGLELRVARIRWESKVQSLDWGDMKPVEGRKRVVIEKVQPQVDCRRSPGKRSIGDSLTVTAAVFGDGH